MINVYSVNSVTLKTLTNTDKWNNNTYDSAVITCRVEFKTVTVKDASGENVQSKIQVYFNREISVNHADKIVVRGIEYAIIQIMELQSYSLNHIQVFL